MSKEDYIWVAIRIFGILLVVMAIIAIPTILSSAFMVWGYHSAAAAMSGEAISDMQDTIAQANFGTMLSATFRAILYYAAGVYFLKGGKFVHKLIARFPAGQGTPQ